MMRHLAAVGWDKACQEELGRHPNPPDHMFGDIGHFYTERVADTLASIQASGTKLSLDALKPMIMTGKAMRPCAPCLVHGGGLCEHPRAKIHDAGPPCIAFSPMGKQDKNEGKSMIHIAAWFGMRRMLREPVLVVEESNRFDPKIYGEWLGDIYYIQTRVVDPTHFGWCGRRPRLWAVMLLKDSLLSPPRLMVDVINHYKRELQATWDVLLVADREEELKGELEQELQWACKRPKSQAKGKDLLALQKAGYNLYLAALTPMEEEYLNEYQQQKPGAVVMLNQNPASGFGMASTDDGLLYTIIHNPGLHWSQKHRRWLSGSEMLLSQGFPVVSRLANPRGSPARCASFCASVGSGKSTTEPGSSRTRNCKVAQAGNSMNISVCGFMKVYILLFVELMDMPGLPACSSQDDPQLVRGADERRVRRRLEGKVSTD